MSTRRLRIKAVAALPPRRKNAESTDNARNRPLKENTDVENGIKSPATPKTYSKSDDKIETKSPGQLSISSSPVVTATSVAENLPPLAKTRSPRPVTMEDVASRSTNNTIETDSSKTTPESEKAHQVSVITTTPNFQSTNNVFASPQVKNSTDKREFMSPVGRNLAPKIIDIAAKANSTTINGNESSSIVESASNTLLDSENRTDDYSIPSAPESITEEAMDGIVPLQPAARAPNPISMLKNEIVSDYAEVLFDPIVPLPSPSKVRPKLRPVPRLAPHRRNSVQGSASESEDENRRSLLSGAPAPAPPPRQRHDSHQQHQPPPRPTDTRSERIRNDSLSSQSGLVHPSPALSPVKEKQSSKGLRQEMSKRTWKRRRECRDSVKRDNLTMYDLIFYNPTDNPLIPDQEEMKAKEENAKEAERAAIKSSEAPESEEEDDAAPVPQIKLGPNGELILDEKSLVIKQSDANRKVETVVREGTWSGNGRYTRTQRTADWTPSETVRFYRALAAIGTDFSLMAGLFPDRTRRCLKVKFKKEERLNLAQVDKALRSVSGWGPSQLLEEFTEERKQEALDKERAKRDIIANKQAEQKRIQAQKTQKIRTSRASRALEVQQVLQHDEMTADDFVRRTLRQKKAQQAKRPRRNVRYSSVASNASSVPPEHDPSDITTQPSPYASLTLLRPGNSKRGISNTPDMAIITRAPQGAYSPAITTRNPQAVHSSVTNAIIRTPQYVHSPATTTRTHQYVHSPATTHQDIRPATTQSAPNMDEVEGPPNIENGSLVVLRVKNPVDPTKTMLQTYISHGDGKLTPVSLPPDLLHSVVGYMKQGPGSLTPDVGSSPQSASIAPPPAPAPQGMIISSPSNAQDYRILGI